jgi:FtsP/CotA-like multicopper oxidase with cupredoxin domain
LLIVATATLASCGPSEPVAVLKPGTKTLAWTNNGSVPGPLIRGRVGDRLIVHFKNSLPA